MFFPAFDNELVSSKLGPFGEAHREFRPTRLPPLQCAFKSFQDNDIMRKMPVSCCLDKFWERCASLHCFALLQVGEVGAVDSIFQKITAIVQLSRGAVAPLRPFKKWPNLQTPLLAHSIPLECSNFYKPDEVNGRFCMLRTSVDLTSGYMSHNIARQGLSTDRILPLQGGL